MIWENFKDHFHESWHNKMRPWIESEDCDKVYEFLKKEGRRGKQIAPLSHHTFRCFKETPLDELKVVFMGLCPYHTFRNGQPVADGLLMGCSVTNYPQPSLDNFYGGIERELYKGLNLHFIKDPDVSYLARQGVLMTNVALTTEKNKPGSHVGIWENFTIRFLSDILFGVGVPIVFLGKDAGKYQKYVPPFTWSFVISHPASAAYSHTEWDTEGIFRKLNKILKDTNDYKINWIKTKER